MWNRIKKIFVNSWIINIYLALKITMEIDFSNNDNNFIEERINANIYGNLNNNNVNNENQINIFNPNDCKKEVIINKLVNNNIIHNNLNRQ